MPNNERIQTSSSQTAAPTSASSSTSKIAERLGTVSEQASQLAHDVQEKGSALIHQAGEKVSSTYRDAQAETSELLHELDDRARYAGRQTARYARRVGTSTSEFVRANALPLAVVGAGLGWLAWNVVGDAKRQRALAAPPRNVRATLGGRELASERSMSRPVPPPPPAATTTSGAKLIGVRVSDSNYPG